MCRVCMDSGIKCNGIQRIGTEARWESFLYTTPSCVVLMRDLTSNNIHEKKLVPLFRCSVEKLCSFRVVDDVLSSNCQLPLAPFLLHQ